jgi:hypothetical protein
MSTERIPVSASPVEPPTLEEVRLKLAHYVVDAQRAELQRQIRRLAETGTKDGSKAA